MRRNRGSKEEAMRKIRGESAVHPTFSRPPSHLFPKPVTNGRERLGVRNTFGEGVDQFTSSPVYKSGGADTLLLQK
jgi:hypothetical protein